MFSVKRIVAVVTLMLIFISASGCTPDATKKEDGELTELDTLEAPIVGTETSNSEKTGEEPAQSEKPTASGTDVVWTPFV